MIITLSISLIVAIITSMILEVRYRKLKKEVTKKYKRIKIIF